MATFACTPMIRALNSSSPSLYPVKLGSDSAADRVRRRAAQLASSVRKPSLRALRRRVIAAPICAASLSNPVRSPSLRRRVIAAPVCAASPSNPVGSGGSGDVEGSRFGILLPLLKFVNDNYMSVALLGGMVIGLSNPTLGFVADRYYVPKLSTFGIFIISGLSLRSEEIGSAAQAWPVGMFGLASILFFTPLFSRLILQLSLQPREFITGLALFSCMPTTLSSAIALTQIAGGNSALALAMTVISNLVGILVVPFTISKLVAAGIGVSIPTEKLFTSLVLMLLVPLIIGKVLRESFRGLADFTDKNRRFLSILSVLLLSANPLIQMSKARPLLLMVNPSSFLLVVAMAIILHLVLLGFNAAAIKVMAAITGGSKSEFAKQENGIALLLVASQKTLPVLIAVVDQLDGSLGASGLLTLPCVAAHLIQIIMDSVLVNSLLRNGQLPRPSKAS